MRIIEYPPEEIEQQVRCQYCKALLGYRESETNWRYGISSCFKSIICPNCYGEIFLETVRHPDACYAYGTATPENQ